LGYKGVDIKESFSMSFPPLAMDLVPENMKFSSERANEEA